MIEICSGLRAAITAPLADITVIEVDNYMAAPSAGAILADMGATVIKVEPLSGDPMRGIGRLTNNRSSEGGVAMYNDGFFTSSVYSFSQSTLFLERTEVLLAEGHTAPEIFDRPSCRHLHPAALVVHAVRASDRHGEDIAHGKVADVKVADGVAIGAVTLDAAGPADGRPGPEIAQDRDVDAGEAGGGMLEKRPSRKVPGRTHLLLGLVKRRPR